MTEYLKRFSPKQVYVHFLYAVSVLVLYVTGLPIFFPDQLGWILTIMGGAEVTMVIHRIAAVVMAFSVIYFLIYAAIATIIYDKGILKRVLPTPTDIKDLMLDVKYAFGLSGKKPRLPKYGYLEKTEVWIIGVEAVIFIVTGLVLWFPTLFLEFMSLQTVLAFRYIHGAFAVLSLAGFLFHFMNVHMHPEKYPIEMSIFSGDMEKQEAQEEHPKWVEGGQ
ncbi:Formate dehydrogenase cytochrome b556 subunit [Methanonatronarchaeum thermophilum]|uniref:Formate dehydrogenase cytochrome b556 subunit n=1 Tax=Methanonatronarchaeum thermophilum TaxID=1927129 RepID=A0A1Y3GE06_9EURY|nr:cytochrome b/b6 domain-containing protein [Methanonatronarchaeum thermophilum]OUJ19447.1 Formate dehydrogenase cytochrome b556 subunit [Methanonatronarchaeum thermophilum]